MYFRSLSAAKRHVRKNSHILSAGDHELTQGKRTRHITDVRIIYLGDGVSIEATGRAICNPADVFDAERRREIALGRAVAAIAKRLYCEEPWAKLLGASGSGLVSSRELREILRSLADGVLAQRDHAPVHIALKGNGRG